MKKSKIVTLLLVGCSLTACKKQVPQWGDDSLASPTPGRRGVVMARPWYYFGHGGGVVNDSSGVTSNGPEAALGARAIAETGSVSRGGFGSTGHGFSAAS